MEFWLVTGFMGNLRTTFKNNKWGLSERYNGIWKRISKGDILIFYASKPIGGVIGIGVIESKNKEESLLWPDEVQLNRTLYPNRIFFKVLFLLKEDKWEKEKISISDLSIVVQASMNPLRDEGKLNSLLDRINSSWGIKVVF